MGSGMGASSLRSMTGRLATLQTLLLVCVIFQVFGVSKLPNSNDQASSVFSCALLTHGMRTHVLAEKQGVHHASPTTAVLNKQCVRGSEILARDGGAGATSFYGEPFYQHPPTFNRKKLTYTQRKASSSASSASWTLVQPSTVASLSSRTDA